MRAAAAQPQAGVASACGTYACGTGALPPASSDAQTAWAAQPVRERLKVLRAARHLMARRAESFAAAISPQLVRNAADTLATELLPLLAACRFLEQNAERLLKPRRLGRSGRPLWLGAVQSEIHREPLGHILLIGPSNFPLFLVGVQAMQALVAGNSVTWKPGLGGAAVARLFQDILTEAGLPAGLLTVTGETVEAAQRALAEGPDKVVFTGSSRSGQAILAKLAETSTPAVVELSGADAVVVTPAADLPLVARAVAFGLRLNGAAVCMSPRRLFATRATLAALRPLLYAELAKVPAVQLDPNTARHLDAMLHEATSTGAATWSPGPGQPVLVENATPGMAVTRSDIFAPVLSLLEAPTMMHIPEMYAQCPYALTLAIFCGRSETRKAMAVARTLRAGTVLLNDLIAPTVDPRVPFGGRGASGYGVTRGAEGLLEMTAIKTLLVRRGGIMLHLDATTAADVPLFAGLIGLLHGKGWARRWGSLQQLVNAARQRKLP